MLNFFNSEKIYVICDYYKKNKPLGPDFPLIPLGLNPRGPGLPTT